MERPSTYEAMTDLQLATLRKHESVPVNLEFKRRELEIQRGVARAQIKAARWTMWSAIAVAASVLVTALGIWVDAIQFLPQR